MYNNYYQPTNYQRPAPALKGRPVASFEEARASTIDFDGQVFYFPDLANKRIYTKQINMDGTATMLMYELKEMPVEETPAYVTRQEFEETISKILATVKAPTTEYKF